MDHLMPRLALALLAFGACTSELEPRMDCEEPAPLVGEKDAGQRYVVLFREGTAAGEATARLASKLGFTPRHVYDHALLGFAAELTDAALACVRCDPEVKEVRVDQAFDIR